MLRDVIIVRFLPVVIPREVVRIRMVVLTKGRSKSVDTDVSVLTYVSPSLGGLLSLMLVSTRDVVFPTKESLEV